VKEKIVQLCEATDKKDEAVKWSRELDASRAAQTKSEKKPRPKRLLRALV
jgi:hypothetical protein